MNNLDYKTCKRLNDAGFPQDTKESFVWNPPQKKEEYRTIMPVGANGRRNLLASDYEVIACPQLEELIEACGDDFYGLLTQAEMNDEELEKVAKELGIPTERWFAKSYSHVVFGKTPEEAVAKLWLKLNEKIHITKN